MLALKFVREYAEKIGNELHTVAAAYKDLLNGMKCAADELQFSSNQDGYKAINQLIDAFRYISW